jgi:hypothetical protein
MCESPLALIAEVSIMFCLNPPTYPMITGLFFCAIADAFVKKNIQQKIIENNF